VDSFSFNTSAKLSGLLPDESWKIYLMNQKNNSEVGQIILGMLEVFGVNILLMFLMFTIPIISIIQLVYVIPRGNYLYKNQQQARLKGTTIGAVITFLLNGACWLAVMTPR
jgi:hypothetical protein